MGEEGWRRVGLSVVRRLSQSSSSCLGLAMFVGASGILFSDGAALYDFVVLAGAGHDGGCMGASGILFGDDVFAGAFGEGV